MFDFYKQSRLINKNSLKEMKTRTILNLLFSIYIATSGLGCNNSQSQSEKSLEMKSNETVSEDTKRALQSIKDKRILFLHHSVGGNILNGLRTLASESNVELKIETISEKPISEDSYFVHWNGGQNKIPKSKVDSFSSQIEKLSDKYVPQVAFMKFCYVDINPNTDVNELFTYYKNTMERLQKERPDIKFIYLTVPLEEKTNKFTDRIKRLIGEVVWQDESNVKRAEFNKLLYETYPKEQIFDLARVESTLPDGTRSSFTKNGETYYSLASIYTNDGGHLNDLGQRRVASEMAHFLAGMLEKN
jgi:hypothetical protein